MGTAPPRASLVIPGTILSVTTTQEENSVANPALNPSRTRQFETASQAGTGLMSRAGVVRSLAFFAVMLLAGAAVGWHLGTGASVSSKTNMEMLVSLLVALVMAFVIIARPKLARTLGVVYALLEGFVLGIISAAYETQYHGIVAEAVGCTLGVALVVWFLYGTGIIKVTSRLTKIISMAVLGAMAFYLVSILTMVFGGPDLDGGSGVLGIGVSLVLAAIAASTFLLDFDRVDKLIAAGASSEYDAFGAFGLLISLIWLYLEILNILSRLRGGGIRR
jgi:uncharacterized YccA/Bax inhibitor family protein